MQVYQFSAEEIRVLELLAQGLNDHEIAEELGIGLSVYRRRRQALADKIDSYEPQTNVGLSQALMFERSRRAITLAELHATESRLFALMDLSPFSILIVDGYDGLVVRANDRCEEIFGYPPDELVGMSVESLMTEDKRALHVKQRTGFLRSIRKREIGYHPPIHALTRNGTEVELVIGLIATTSTDDVMVVCTKTSDVAVQSRGTVTERTPSP